MYIYKVTNLINGKIYIGQQLNPKRKSYMGSGILIKNAINKYGRKNFIKEIIEYCTTKESMNEKEKYWINKLNSNNLNIGYNIDKGGGRTLEEDYVIKMSQKLKGRKISEEAKINISKNHADVSGENNPMWGKTHTDESKDKIIKAIKKWNEEGGYNNEIRLKKSLKTKGRKNPNYNPTPVLQFDLDGNFIKEWEDLFTLRESGFNSKHISSICRGLGKTAFGYIWKFKNIDYE
jgi:group I intron endonuclease